MPLLAHFVSILFSLLFFFQTLFRLSFSPSQHLRRQHVTPGIRRLITMIQTSLFSRPE